MTFSGMDPEAVDGLAGQLATQAAAINGIVSLVDTVTSALSDLWFGETFGLFHNVWHGSQKPQAHTVAVDIAGVVTLLQAQATQQRAASRASGGGSGHVLAPTRPHSSPRPAKPREYLELAAGAYNHPPKVIHADGHAWTPLSAADLMQLGISESDLRDAKSGFSATIYRSDDGRLVVSYEGTDGLSPPDVGTDARGATPGYALITGGEVDKQSQEAVELAILAHRADQNVTFTGHSLGGRLASLASVATERPAMTFNAAGANGADVAYARTAGGHDTSFGQFVGDLFNLHPDENARITAYVGDNDPVNNGQNSLSFPPAMGTVHHIHSSSSNPIDAHQVDDLRKNVTDSD